MSQASSPERPSSRSGATRTRLFQDSGASYDTAPTSRMLDQWLVREDFQELPLLQRIRLVQKFASKLQSLHEQNEVHGNLAHSKIVVGLTTGGTPTEFRITKEKFHYHPPAQDDNAMLDISAADPIGDESEFSPAKNVGFPQVQPPEFKSNKVGKKSDIFMFANVAQAILKKPLGTGSTKLDYSLKSTTVPQDIFSRLVNGFFDRMQSPNFRARPNAQTLALFFNKLNELVELYDAPATKSDSKENSEAESQNKKTRLTAELLLISAGSFSKYTQQLEERDFCSKVVDLFNQGFNVSEDTLQNLGLRKVIQTTPDTAGIVNALSAQGMRLSPRQLRAVEKLEARGDLPAQVISDRDVISAMINCMEWKRNALVYSAIVTGAALAAVFILENMQPGCVEQFLTAPDPLFQAIPGYAVVIILTAIVFALIALWQSYGAKDDLKKAILQHDTPKVQAKVEDNDPRDFRTPFASPAKPLGAPSAWTTPGSPPPAPSVGATPDSAVTPASAYGTPAPAF